MFSTKNRILFAVITALLFASVTGAQQKQSEPTSNPDDRQAAPNKDLRSRVFEIKHRDARNLLSVLMPLGSHVKGASMNYNEAFKTITVRDFPEVIATVEEVIKRLDVPQPPTPPQPPVEFRVHILIASNGGAETTQFPADLDDAIKQLKTTLNYKNYYLMTSQVLRYQGGAGNIGNKGIAELKLNADTPAGKNPIFYNYGLSNIRVETTEATARVGVNEFNFNMKVPLSVGDAKIQYEDIGFRTPVNLRDGEKVLVGTTSLEDKGIIVVLSAKVLK